ncbi:MAG TPA: hypothetical protein DEH78_20225, partial [Solibacterales bacterium]|nr:hypothetical protein [Bryobacterales bacterium]
MPITRDLVIVYGSTTVGGSTARQIDGYHIVGPKGYASAAVEFSFITTAASQSALATECNTLEAAFRQPRQNLTITLGGNTILSLSHSGNTGFDASPSIIKAGDPADTGLSRHYTVRIDFGMPADNVSTSFRRDSSVTVEYSAARRRRVTISGTYTANTDGTTAYAQYN